MYVLAGDVLIKYKKCVICIFKLNQLLSGAGFEKIETQKALNGMIVLKGSIKMFQMNIIKSGT